MFYFQGSKQHLFTFHMYYSSKAAQLQTVDIQDDVLSFIPFALQSLLQDIIKVSNHLLIVNLIQHRFCLFVFLLLCSLESSGIALTNILLSPFGVGIVISTSIFTNLGNIREVLKRFYRHPASVLLPTCSSII